MRHKTRLAVAMFSLLATASNAANAAGPDVVVGDLTGTNVYARFQGIAAISVGTISCNAGDAVLQWNALPSNRHPIISLNMYRLADGRLEHIGQSWVKHGFKALNNAGNLCNLQCRRNVDNQGLGVGCSDPYSATNNLGPGMRARSDINPSTGFYDGDKLFDPVRRERITLPQVTPIDRGLQVAETDLMTPGARYFVEGQYVTADDAESGNSLNNASYREVGVKNTNTGNFAFANLSGTVQQAAAIRVWPGAKFTTLDTVEAEAQGRRYTSRITVASRVTPLAGNRFRYDYAVHNQNSERGIGSFSIDVGAAQITGVGFKAVRSHGEPWSNDPWASGAQGGKVTWSTTAFAQNPNANAIRWGTMYNFWFESNVGPADGAASLGRFKPGAAGGDRIEARIDAPAVR